MDVRDIHEVACVGAGTIGSSWATLVARQGYRVTLYDLSAEVLQAGMGKVRRNYQTLVENGAMPAADVEPSVARISTTTDLVEAVRSADFVLESGPEMYEIKRGIFRDIDRLSRPEVVLSSSSSGLLMSEIQSVVQYPARCVISHPYNPPHIVPLVEIVKGTQTSADTVDLTRAFMSALGKVPVVACKEVPWYIANRLQNALIKEAIWLVGNGVASAQDVDLALTAGPGVRWALMGPFMTGTLASPGGLRDTLLDKKFRGEALDKTALGVEESGHSPEEIMQWRRTCVEQMEAALAGKDREQLRAWRDRKLLQILAVLAAD